MMNMKMPSHYKTVFMIKLLMVLLSILCCTRFAASQVTYVDTKTDGEGGLEGIVLPKNLITDTTGKNIFIVAHNCLTYFTKTGPADTYTFVKSIKYSSDLYNGLWNADEVKSACKGKFLYVTGDNQLNVFSFNGYNQTLNFLESIKNSDELKIGGATSTHISIPNDSRNLYLATTDGTDPILHIFTINAATGLLTHKKTIDMSWIQTGYFTAVQHNPSDQYVYAFTGGYNDDPCTMSVFKRHVDADSLELVQVLSTHDSITAPSRFVISNDNKNLYVCEGRTIKVFEINPSDGKLSYSDRFKIPATFEGYWGTNSATISEDGQYLYLGGEYCFLTLKRDIHTGKLTFIQVFPEDVSDQSEMNHITSMNVSNHDSLLYVVNQYNNSIHVFSRDFSSGELILMNKLVDKQGKIFGLSDASDILITNNDKLVITVAPSGFNSIAVFNRNDKGALSFRRNIPWNELGPEIGAPQTFAITPDDSYLYITSVNMFGIRLMKRDFTGGEFKFSESYTYENAGLPAEESITDAAISKDMKYLYTATYSNILNFEIQDSGKLNYKSIYSIKENSENGLKSVQSIALSQDNKYLYTSSASEFYPDGITVFKRDPVNGSLSFLQKIAPISISKVLVSNDNKYVYGLGDQVYCYAVDDATGNLTLVDQLNIEDLNYSQVYRLDDGIVSRDNKSIIAVTRQGKAILSFYRDSETGKVIFKEVRFYSANLDYSNGGPKIIMSNDSKNVYLVSPYEGFLKTYMANVPLGLPQIFDACGDTARVTIDEGYEYLWSNGDTTNQFTTTDPGTYSVYVKDTLGREGWDKTKVMFHELPDVSIELYDPDNYNPSWYLVASVDGEGYPFTYQWNDGNSGIINNVDESELYINNQFHVVVTDRYGCKASDTLTIEEGTGVNSPESFIHITISPNPVSSNLFIYFSEPVQSKMTIEIYDAGGNKVLHETPEINATTYSANVSHYPSGIYILKIKSMDAISNYKIVKR
jgi:6-phosphogluconolactonase (cycloisomerase 2 family)